MGRPAGRKNRPKTDGGTADLFAEPIPVGARAASAPSTDAPRLTHADPADWPVHPDWQPLLARFWAGSTGQALLAQLRARLAAGAVIYPPQPLRALTHLAPAAVRVLILGQDPYHGPGQAEGLAFSVAPGVKIPPSLRNIFKELRRDLGYAEPAHGSLMAWADHGVLLLNTSLTVEDGHAGRHANFGWQALTDEIVREVSRKSKVCVSLLWGAHAQAKAQAIVQTAADHGHSAHVLCANHPSPLSALRGPTPFIGCGHFGQAQAWLQAQGLDWWWPELASSAR